MEDLTLHLCLTAVQDSKICWRIDNYFGPEYKALMRFWDREEEKFADVMKKSWFTNEVALSHYIFRNYMGAVDQSDVKSHIIRLTRETVSVWHRKQLAFLCETAIVNAHANYCLDPSAPSEHFAEWFKKFCSELLKMSRNYRKVKTKPATPTPKASRRHRKKVATPRKKRRLLSPYGSPTEAGIACHGSKNLAIWLEFNPKRSWKRCRFCGKKGVQFSCSACGETFCLAQPTHLIQPGSHPERHFPANGLMCWHYLHGYTSKTDIRK